MMHGEYQEAPPAHAKDPNTLDLFAGSVASEDLFTPDELVEAVASAPAIDEPLPSDSRVEESAQAAPALFGTDLFGRPHDPGRSKGKLGDLFLLPPFTVLDTRQGYWQERKRAWLAHGIRSEIGRVADAMGGVGQRSVYGGQSWAGDRGPQRETEGPGFFKGDQLRNNERFQQAAGGNLLKFSPMMNISRNGDGTPNGSEFYAGDISREELGEANSTSIFDPVLCECCYRWFCPPNGLVLDPFAGGSVRGILAALLGLRYLGIELRPEQIVANEEQRAQILAPQAEAVNWLCGDSRVLVPTLSDAVDFVFSCPPYADLERYSEEPEDLSTMPYPVFLEAYRAIIQASLQRLKPNRFAAFVVTELREKDTTGCYRNFVRDTIAAFEDHGARFYNEAVIVNAIGSLPLRVQKQFNATRKLGRTHQYLLVFLKGDPRQATKECTRAE